MHCTITAASGFLSCNFSIFLSSTGLQWYHGNFFHKDWKNRNRPRDERKNRTKNIFSNSVLRHKEPCLQCFKGKSNSRLISRLEIWTRGVGRGGKRKRRAVYHDLNIQSWCVRFGRLLRAAHRQVHSCSCSPNPADKRSQYWSMRRTSALVLRRHLRCWSSLPSLSFLKSVPNEHSQY